MKIAVLILLVGVSALAAEIPVRNESLRNEVRRGIDRGVEFLAKSQDAGGFWSTADQPAVTGLVLTAMRPAESAAKYPEVFAKGYSFVRKQIKEDGSIHAGALVNYNTSLCLMALATRGAEEDRGAILAARRYLISSQVDLGETNRIDTAFDGGVGYGSKYKHSDMGNTLAALEALYASRQFAADAPNEPKLNFAAARNFLASCQNLPSHNKEAWASDDAANKGGFIYYPGNSMAGTNLVANGRVALRSYGSISYAGLLSYIYADMPKDDPRVKAVVEWLDKNYTLEENPGMGPQGYFYYLHTMTKALTIAKIETIAGKPWREAVALKLLNLQKDDGSWQNENNRWWEKDKALVTAYAVMALRAIEAGL